MKLKGLSVGNILNYSNAWNYAGHNGEFVLSETDFHKSGECTFDFKEVSPIILTVERLLKFGFKRSKYQDNIFSIKLPSMLYLQIYFIDENAYDAQLWFHGKVNNVFYIDLGGHQITIKHVHQLQNLFFEMTGTDLKYK